MVSCSMNIDIAASVVTNIADWVKSTGVLERNKEAEWQPGCNPVCADSLIWRYHFLPLLEPTGTELHESKP